MSGVLRKWCCWFMSRECNKDENNAAAFEGNIGDRIRSCASGTEENEMSEVTFLVMKHCEVKVSAADLWLRDVMLESCPSHVLEELLHAAVSEDLASSALRLLTLGVAPVLRKSGCTALELMAQNHKAELLRVALSSHGPPSPSLLHLCLSTPATPHLQDMHETVHVLLRHGAGVESDLTSQEAENLFVFSLLWLVADVAEIAKTLLRTSAGA